MAYVVTSRCRACHFEWRWKSRAQSLTTLTANPPCPKCRKAQKDIGMDVGGGKAPGVGGSDLGRAMEAVSQEVMTDFGMTNLASARVGETMAPKLPAVMQAQADGMFSTNRRNMNLPPQLRGSPSQVLQRAVSGQFRSPDTPDPVALAQPQVPAPNFLIQNPGRRRPQRG